jgi:hypothetical protein
MSETDAQEDPPIAFDKWAPIAAEMLYRASAERLEILHRHSLIVEHWTPSDTHWSGVLAQEIIAGNYGRANIYAQYCAAEMKARREKSAPVEPVREVEPKEAAETKAIPTAPVVEEKPPMLGTPPPLAYAPVDAPKDVPYTPVLDAPPPLAFVPPLGFGAPDGDPKPPMVAHVPPKPVKPNALKSTAWAGEIPQGPSLPFVPPSVSGDSAATITKPAEQVQRPKPQSNAGRALFQTAGTPDAEIIARPIMPFKGDAPVEAAPPATPSSPERVEVKPAPAAAAPSEPEWTLEQYASLCAELEMAPERTHETLQRYRVRPDQKVQLDAHWGARIRADQALHAAFHHAKTTYAAWLMNTRRGS